MPSDFEKNQQGIKVMIDAGDQWQPTEQDNEILDLLWPNLRADRANPRNRVQTGFGTKTKEGLCASVRRVTGPRLELTNDETEQLIKMVRARIAANQAFQQARPDLTILVAKLLNWSKGL